MGIYSWYDSLKGSLCGLNPRGINTHFAYCILIEQVQAAAAVHKDSSEVKSVDDGVED